MTDSSRILIRAAQVDDAGTVLGFIRDLAEYERLGDAVVASRGAIEETLFGAEPCAEILIAEWDGEAAGFALFFPNYSTFLAKPGMYLEDLFVRPRFRGKGIGRALLEQLAQIAVERGYGRLDWSVLDWNTPAIEFYRGIGAQALDDWTQFRLDGAALKRLGRKRR